MEWVRPWGEYKILGENPVAVKLLTIKPKSRLSLQSHDLRSEIWFALESGLTAEIDGRIIEMQPLHRILVEAGQKHRLINNSENLVNLVELIYGEYKESDIFRFEDDYGRV